MIKLVVVAVVSVETVEIRENPYNQRLFEGSRLLKTEKRKVRKVCQNACENAADGMLHQLYQKNIMRKSRQSFQQMKIPVGK